MFKDRRVGGIGNVGVFSFFGNKIITTGEGGMLVTNDDETARRVELLKNHGMARDRKYWHPIIGYNYRMTNLQAALGLAQLERIEQFISKKRRIAKWYMERLGSVEGVSFQQEASWAKSVFWMNSIIIDEKRFGISRDEVMAKLRKRGIDSRPLFYPIHIMPPYGRRKGEHPIAESLAKKGVNLPSGTNLSENTVKFICDTVKEISRP